MIKNTLIYCVKNEFNPTSEVQNIENGVFQNTPFGIAQTDTKQQMAVFQIVVKVASGHSLESPTAILTEQFP